MMLVTIVLLNFLLECREVNLKVQQINNNIFGMIIKRNDIIGAVKV
jgi:hypothetical protein